MRTFHVQLLSQGATESYSIHHAASNNLPTKLAQLIFLVSAHLKRNQQTKRVPLKKKELKYI